MSTPLVQTTGRRKGAVARVRIRPGSGTIKINSRDVTNYFPSKAHQMILTEPLRLTETDETYDVDATLHGGGVSGQAGALRWHRPGLVELDPRCAPAQRAGFLTRDQRERSPRVRPEEGPQGAAVQQALTATGTSSGSSPLVGSWGPTSVVSGHLLVVGEPPC